MNKLTISTKLSMLICVMAALLVLIGSIGLYGMSKSDDALESMYKDRVVAISQLSDIDYLLLRNRLLVANSVIEPGNG